jgi:hypothetical protein
MELFVRREQRVHIEQIAGLCRLSCAGIHVGIQPDLLRDGIPTGSLRVGICHPGGMCRNIRVLHNFEPPATSDEVQAAALQYVRKVSGTTKPSAANKAAFERAVHEIAHITQHLLDDLVTVAPPKDREREAAKARARSADRYGPRSERVAG